MEVNSVFFSVARIMQTPVFVSSYCSTKINFLIWKLINPVRIMQSPAH